MVRRIGKYSVLLFALSLLVIQTICAEDVLSIRLTDINGDQLKQAVVNVPFCVEVVVYSEEQHVGVPEIVGIKQFIIDDKVHMSTINSIINGQRSTKKIYRFILRSAQEGTFTIGPARTTINKKTYLSQKLTVVVGKEPIVDSHEPFLKLMSNKQQVFIGQKIQCILRFYVGKNTHLEGIAEPNFTAFDVAGPLEGPFPGKENIDDITREYFEWRTTLIPKKIGSTTIPAVGASIKNKSKRRHSFFDFSSFFDDLFEQKQIFSNALTIDVIDLPKQNGVSANAVGVFKLLRAHTQSNRAKEGEGVVYMLKVVGDGNIVSAPPLQMPNGLNYYESKTYQDKKESSGTDQVTVFEYIVQATRPGTFTIPEQSFVYFNPETKKIGTIKSNALKLEIQQLQPSVNSVAQEEKKPLMQTSNKNEMVSSQSPTSVYYLPLEETLGPWMVYQMRYIPWYLFIMLTLLPIVILGITISYRIFGWIRHRKGACVNMKKVFKDARMKIKNLYVHDNYEQLYDIFIHIFATKYNRPAIEINEGFIEKVFLEKGISETIIDQWRIFFKDILRCKFGAAHYQHSNNLLMEHAEQWVQYLEKVL